MKIVEFLLLILLIGVSLNMRAATKSENLDLCGRLNLAILGVVMSPAPDEDKYQELVRLYSEHDRFCAFPDPY